ncbi:hypothetical protein EZS27_018326 [termite gut metagenome]|uniref:Uncharacterized protein n=1 Tax=termite gut metagenome TaxID=433724 RepID=A0A5J4RK60_9ZZZZ
MPYFFDFSTNNISELALLEYPFFCEFLLQNIDKYLNANVDVVYFKAQSVDSDTLLPADRSVPCNKLIDNYLNGRISALVFSIDYMSPWCKLLDRSFIVNNNIIFDEIFVSNDVMFSVNVAFLQKFILVSNSIIYCITYRTGSLTTLANWEAFKGRFDIAIKRNKFLKEKGYSSRANSLILFVLKSKKYGIRIPFKLVYEIMKEGMLFTGIQRYLCNRCLFCYDIIERRASSKNSNFD